MLLIFLCISNYLSISNFTFIPYFDSFAVADLILKKLLIRLEVKNQNTKIKCKDDLSKLVNA